ncbi:negative regulation of extrinsic apoptotic signaling pathway [Cichlidogyrus casuarinus]|uniref:Negative regulation of extrinsic apoptotic signaling pathway n=1 Tax=Cichlidogyrus casuarinus TaxID=1844966 RepID=A0ABD2QDH3_9PLAT
MSNFRYTDPVYLQYIWDALDYLTQTDGSRSFDSLYDFIRTNKDPKCNSARIQAELSNATKDAVISINGNDYFRMDISKLTRNKHDWYCFECHTPGLVIACPSCHRVFHKDCLQTASQSSKNNALSAELSDTFYRDVSLTGPCPICLLKDKIQLPTEHELDLPKILLTCLDRMKNKQTWKQLGFIGYLNDSARNNYFLLMEVNTKTIGDKLKLAPKAGGYSSRSAVLADVDQLVHNSAIIYGPKADMSNSARQLRSMLKKELRESTFCIDCYLHSESAKNIHSRITLACRRPHQLVWYQHNGWSFWPFKVLSEDDDSYEVVSFGGRHDRNYVPKERTTAFSFGLAHDLGLRMTPALRKALDEVKEYQANQARSDQQNPPTCLQSHQGSPSDSSLSKPTKQGKKRLRKSSSEAMLEPKKPKVSEASTTSSLLFAAASQAACSYSGYYTTPQQQPATAALKDSSDSDSSSSSSSSSSTKHVGSSSRPKLGKMSPLQASSIQSPKPPPSVAKAVPLSVSPAALSSASSSGLGSSLCGDPKSVDTSPGANGHKDTSSLVASTNQMLSSMAATLPAPSPEANLRRELEEVIHADYAERISRLSRDRDNAREETRRLERALSEMKRLHENELKATKQKCWCHVCLKEAYYHCCAGVSYCSQTCQLDHWTSQHSRECRRANKSQTTCARNSETL